MIRTQQLAKNLTEGIQYSGDGYYSSLHKDLGDSITKVLDMLNEAHLALTNEGKFSVVDSHDDILDELIQEWTGY